MRRTFAIITACVMLIIQTAALAQGYPERSINGVIQWGAGGGTDSLMRPLCTLAEKELGASIVIKNMSGGTGSIATQHVYDKASDGYTLLLGAENPALYKALHISELTYADFTCVLLIGDETVGIVVNKDSKYSTFNEIVSDALQNPGGVTLSTTGTGGLPWAVAAFITHVTGATFNQIPYDSDASARTAVMNGECAFTVCKVQSGIEAWKAGEIRYLAMMSRERAPIMAEVPPITDEYPSFAEYLPWGPFYGVFVKRDTDAAITERLSAAFAAAYASPAYQEVLDNFYINALGYTGDIADEYIDGWQLKTLAALRSSGAVED